eukprot:scaffold108720_cov40-Attheya_sp.AAC.3
MGAPGGHKQAIGKSCTYGHNRDIIILAKYEREWIILAGFCNPMYSCSLLTNSLEIYTPQSDGEMA